MKPAQITAVVTCHESDDLLLRALQSIRAQGPIPILLLDDGSRSCACQRLPPNPLGITRVVLPRGGQGASLNVGVARVATPFVAFLDYDDEWLPGKAERQQRLLCDAPVDVVVGGVWNVHEVDGEVIDRRLFPHARVLGAVTARTDAVRRVGPFPDDGRQHAIVDWWSRAVAMGIRIAEDPEPALLRHIHGGNEGIRFRDEARADLLLRLRNHVARGRAR